MKKLTIPKYTLGEEIFNAISHGVGALLAIAALVLTIIFSSIHHSPIAVVSSVVYGVSMIIMYTISCLYHSFSPRLKAKKVFRILDHCDIYIFIAGCYTPYCLCLIGGLSGWIIFSVVWSCALLGVLMNAIDLEKFKVPSFILYLVMGWTALFSFKTIISNIATAGFVLLLVGGIVYSIGAIIYGIGSKKKYLHSIFHLFVLAASVLQFLSILMYVI